MSDQSQGTKPEAQLPLGKADPATVIVFGNEKGGSGKSTGSMHVIVALLRLGFKVGSLDLDMRQWTLTRYLSNRAASMRNDGIDLPMPIHVFLSRSDKPNRAEAEVEDRKRFEAVLTKLRSECDFVVIDCPGTDTYVGRLAHGYADKLVTPINDSFIDLDMLANVDGNTGEIIKPSVYAEMVWEARKQRAVRGGAPLDWIVMRNRLSSLAARNKQEMERVVATLAKRVGFRVAPGFSERVIFRELFLRGLTMLDVFEIGDSGKPQLSHVAARQEVRGLLNALQLPNRTPTPHDRTAEYEAIETPSLMGEGEDS
ncbi:division plane positioning ATPase MipZ [Nisaea sediminum]|uniref:division plane positioning ATPase MipZ n=1 Tax=Nisaea sediminum TaxID=2775867 RepID=UPI0029C0CD66|nr:division plane positioning ATPase MipZ [Nisaea sediminum]